MKSNKKDNKKKKSHIPLRLNLMFFVIFLLFSALILRLGYLQIVSGEEFEAQVQRTETTMATGTVPRGEIYDSQHRKLVGNEPLQAITYTRGQNVSGEDMAVIAFDLAQYIDMPAVTQLEVDSDYDLSRRDLQDFWVAMNREEVQKRLSTDEAKLTGSELNQAELSKVTDEDIEFSDEEKVAAAIFKRMNGAYALSTINIKSEDVTDEEIARVSENLLALPGVDTGTDWVRTYPESSMLRSILGDVTSESEGLPANQASALLAKGYARNDRVGKSYLEQQYEQVLSGSKSQSETETNQSGDVINTIQSYVGEKGDNLVLTINMDFQETVDNIARTSLQENREGLNDRVYVVASDPNTGKILALTGQKVNLETGEIEDDALGAINNAYQMGSSVKGASVLAGYMDGVLTLDDNTMVDEPLNFQGSPTMSSVFNRTGRVTVNDITALEQSSNIYMIKMAMRMGGQYTYTEGGTLNISPNTVISKLRGYYSQFGLGIRTGIDLPNEGSGYSGVNSSAANAVSFAYGQYDTYTPLQMLQYISTIANGGTRIAPRIVDEIRNTNDDGTLGSIETQIEPKILNTVNVGEEEMSRVQQGLYSVVNGSNGSARAAFVGAEYVSAGKTGTAEALYDGPVESATYREVINRTYVGYAPYDDPQIAISVIVPYLSSDTENRENMNIARQVFDAYFQVGEYSDSDSDED